MSVSALSAAFKSPVTVDGPRRFTLLILCEYADDEGYSYPKVSTIARRAAIKRDETVRESLRWLEAEGYIERVVNGWAGVQGQIPEGKRPNLYRVNIDSDGNPTGGGTTRQPGRGSPRHAGTPGSPLSGYQNHHVDPPVEPNPPSPLKGGDGSDDQLAMDDGPSRQDLVEEHDTKTRNVKAAFDPWMKDYPSGQGRGNAAGALKAWTKIIGRGYDLDKVPVTSAEMYERLANFRAARVRFVEYWAARGEDVRPALMNASTFLNRKSILWAEPWDDDDIRYWPPPRGREWDDGARPMSGLQEALQAEIEAERMAKSNG